MSNEGEINYLLSMQVLCNRIGTLNFPSRYFIFGVTSGYYIVV